MAKYPDRSDQSSWMRTLRHQQNKPSIRIAIAPTSPKPNITIKSYFSANSRNKALVGFGEELERPKYQRPRSVDWPLSDQVIPVNGANKNTNLTDNEKSEKAKPKGHNFSDLGNKYDSERQCQPGLVGRLTEKFSNLATKKAEVPVLQQQPVTSNITVTSTPVRRTASLDLLNTFDDEPTIVVNTSPKSATAEDAEPRASFSVIEAIVHFSKGKQQTTRKISRTTTADATAPAQVTSPKDFLNLKKIVIIEQNPTKTITKTNVVVSTEKPKKPPVNKVELNSGEIVPTSSVKEFRKLFEKIHGVKQATKPSDITSPPKRQISQISETVIIESTKPPGVSATPKRQTSQISETVIIQSQSKPTKSDQVEESSSLKIPVSKPTSSVIKVIEGTSTTFIIDRKQPVPRHLPPNEEDVVFPQSVPITSHVESEVGGKTKTNNGIFTGANVIVGKSSILKTRNKKLQILFDETSMVTHEYPSEQDYIGDVDSSPLTNNGHDELLVEFDLDRPNEPVPDYDHQEKLSTKFKLSAATNNDNAGHDDYTPIANGFELGISKVPRPSFINNKSDDKLAWSNAQDADLLF